MGKQAVVSKWGARCSRGCGVWGGPKTRALQQAYPLQPWRGAPKCDYAPKATDDALGAHGWGAVHGSDCLAHSAQ